MNLQKLTEEFAKNVAAQSDAIMSGDRTGGNKYAKRYIAAYKKLRDHGEAGRDALAGLLTHPRMDVRVYAAGCLLSDRPEQALPILREAAKGEGLIPFEASQVLKYWDAGTWSLDID
jgi:hypothetical protein